MLASFLRSPQTRARDSTQSAGRLFVDKAIVCDGAGRVVFNATDEVLPRAEDFIPIIFPVQGSGNGNPSESSAVMLGEAYRDDKLHDNIFVTYVSDLEATDSDEPDSDSDLKTDSDSDADTAKTEEKHNFQVGKAELAQSKLMAMPGETKRTSLLVDTDADALLHDRSREDLDCMDPGVWRCCFDDVAIAAALDAAEEDAERETATWGEGPLASEESCSAWTTRTLR